MEKRVPVCVYDLIGLFAYSMRYTRLKDELNVCHAMQKAIPPSFLKPNAWYRSGNWGFVNNPFRRGNAFLPITNMQFTDPWSHLPEMVCTLLCKQQVRALKTYKGIFFRRVRRMKYWGLKGWNEAFQKSLRHLQPIHFKSRASRALVEGVCEELSEASTLPLEIVCSPALQRVLRLFPAAL